MTGLCGQFPYWPLEETLHLPFDNKIKPVVAQKVKNLPVMQETQVQSLGGEDALEKGMATHFSFLAWRIPRWGGVQDGEHMYTRGGFMSMYGKNHCNIVK